MPKINISAEANAAICSAASSGFDFKNTATKRDDGTFDVPVSRDVMESLLEQQFAGESISDTIIRLVSFYHHGKLS